MANALNNRCAHESWRKQLSFNIEGSKTVVDWKENAEDSMIDVRCKVHEQCTGTLS